MRWHDLRHEYASRLVEKNVPLVQVRDLLGHASIITTERYDNQKLENLRAAAAQATQPCSVRLGRTALSFLSLHHKASAYTVRDERVRQLTSESMTRPPSGAMRGSYAMFVVR